MNGEFSAFLDACLPEVVVGAGICLVLLAGLSGRYGRSLAYVLTLATLAACAWVVGAQQPEAVVGMPGGSFVQDPLSRFLKLFVLALMAAVFVYARAYLRERRLETPEFYVLGLFALLGIFVLVSSMSFLTVFLGLETMALSLYAMVALERGSAPGAEAAMKYFVLGAISSGCLLYGISILYGATGSVLFGGVASAIEPAAIGQVAVLAGLAFVLVAIAFEFGAVPFHMWLPDVYHGAPTCVSLLISTVPKVAAFALAFRILVDALGPVQADWQLLLTVFAVLSLVVGNVVAIVQTNIKRMLAYSTIAHVAFILLGFLAGGDGLQSALYYTVIYALMAAAAFGIVILVGGSGEADQIADFRGLNRRAPWFALMMLIVMISMVGVPPFAGFYAKWWVLWALVDAGQAWLAVVAVIFSVIGAFYYLRIVWLMYFDEGLNLPPVAAALDLRVVLSANSLLLLGLGLFPAGLLELCARALG